LLADYFTAPNFKGKSRLISQVRERGPVWVSAHLALYCWDKVFGFILYPLAIINFDLLWGTAVMMAASLVICVALLTAYDRLGDTRFRDLLGFETVKDVAAAMGQTRVCGV